MNGTISRYRHASSSGHTHTRAHAHFFFIFLSGFFKSCLLFYVPSFFFPSSEIYKYYITYTDTDMHTLAHASIR